MKQVFTLKAKRPVAPNDDPSDSRHWMNIGMATQLEDGNIIITVNALPLNWDGQMKLVPNK